MFQSITASEVMHHGVITTPPQTPLLEVAAEMARHHVHSVVVEGLARGSDRSETLVWGIVSDLDLMKALAAERMDAPAGELAATEILTIEATVAVSEVARVMAEHECTHLIVISPHTGEPIGVISSLDVAEALAQTIPSAS